jgi:hypothetical protein
MKGKRNALFLLFCHFKVLIMMTKQCHKGGQIQAERKEQNADNSQIANKNQPEMKINTNAA